jgi:hypothetical protein
MKPKDQKNPIDPSQIMKITRAEFERLNPLYKIVAEMLIKQGEIMVVDASQPGADYAK